MLPVLFRIGGFEVTSFGVMVALGAATGLWLFRRELLRRGLDGSAGVDAALVGVLAGMIGAKLLFVAEHLDEGLAATLFSRGGMSWFGGLAGGVTGGLLTARLRGLSIVPALSAATPALTIGHAIGRIGCLLVGDDYGVPTDLPWGMAFPEGYPPTEVPVHPTQLYEAIPLFVATAFLVRWRRQGLRDEAVVGRYLLIVGLIRFPVELVRVNVAVAFGLSVAQVFALAAVLAGIVILIRSRGSASVPAPASARREPRPRS